MPLCILLAGFSLFTGAFVLHVLIWRLVDVKREMLSLMLLFVAAPVAMIVTASITGYLGPVETFAVALVSLSLSATYIQFYPGIKVDVPSFRILMLLDESGEAGMSETRLVARIGEGKLFSSKVDELENDRLVVRVDNKIRLSTAGKILALAFIWYRRLLGLEAGKG